MIGILPEIHQDELFYGYLSRYAVMSGYSTFRGVAEDLYVHPTNAPNILLLNDMTKDLLEKLAFNHSLVDIIMIHTMFKWFVRFADYERRQKAFDSALKMNIKELYNSLPIPHNNNRFSYKRVLKYCPRCVEIDRIKNGEAYFRTYHQIPELRICPIHKCYLSDTSVLLAGNATPAFKAADIVIPIENKIVYSDNELENKLAEYVLAVSRLPFDVKNTSDIKDYLNSKLKSTAYIKRNGLRDMVRLTEDFNKYYSVIGITREWWELQKIFTGYCPNAYENSLIGLFLNISSTDLCMYNQ